MNPDAAYAILEDVYTFVENESDIDNEGGPNKAMRLCQQLDEVLTWLETLA